MRRAAIFIHPFGLRMQLLQNEPGVQDFRTALMNFLNEYGLDGAAILSLARRTEPVGYEPGEVVLNQGVMDHHVYFLVKGSIMIRLLQADREETLGERGPVTLLGEISFFNGTPATATVAVTSNGPATFLRLTYEQFREVIEEYPLTKPALARIGEMRMVSQMDGFISFQRYMDMIGWRRDRLAVNRALYPHLEDTIKLRLLPRLQPEHRLLEVGDGPGIVSEIIKESEPDRLPHLFMQVTHLEDAILNPLQSYPSDFSRAKYLRETFDTIVTLQMFEHLKPDEIGRQFQQIKGHLNPDGMLLVVRLRLVDVMHVSGQQDTSLFFTGLETLVQGLWPGVIEDEPLVQVVFVDADIDPMMEWNPRFCDAAVAGRLELPESEQGAERILLGVLLAQARRRQFNPEEINFHWLVWNAAREGLALEDSVQNPEIGFYYQLFRRPPDDDRA